MVLLSYLVLIETNLNKVEVRIDGGFKCAIVGMGSARYSWGSICDYKTVRAEPVEA